MNILLSLNIILPLIAALSTRYKLLGMITSFLLVINNILLLINDDQATLVLAKFLGGYELALKSDPFAIIFALMVSILYFFTNLYSLAYLDAQSNSELNKDLNPKLHFFFTPVAIMAALNIGYSANLITLFVFYEILTLSTYPLVIQSFSENARRAGKYYLSILFGSSSFFLTIALVYIDNHYGVTTFKLGGFITDKQDILFLLICFVFGFSKAAIFPLHKWLPRAMVAPIPVSALLHAVAVVKSGIFALIKVFVFLFGIKNLSDIHQITPAILNWLTLLSCFTIIYAGIKACMQENLKKILAYSTISQLSYMILALSFVQQTSAHTSFLYMISHSIGKITLFFVAGIIYVSLHKVDVKDMKGIIRILPVPVILFILASMSIIGLPFSLGEISGAKLYQTISCDSLIGSISIATLVISKMLSCFYFAKVIFIMISPADQVQTCYYKPTYLTWVTAITFALSFILVIYFSEIERLLLGY